MSLQNHNEEENAERQITPEEYLSLQKTAIRRKSWWAVGIGSILVAAHLIVFFVIEIFRDQLANQIDAEFSWKLLFRSILFIIGLFALAGGALGLRYAKNLRLEDVIPSPEAVKFLQSAQENVNLTYTYILVGCIVAVFLAQLYADGQNTREADELLFSRETAGLAKSLFRQGEWWRVLTGAVLHGGVLHLYFNGQAFYGFGSSIEILSNRAHLAIVFLLAVVGGNLMSLAFLPDGNTVGASGGIMGLIGFLAIYGYRRKQQLPPDFSKSMLINIGFIVAFGLVAYQIVDNFAHLGGLIVGAIYGWAQVPKNLNENPRAVHAVTEGVGLICLGIFVFTSILSILLILQFIKF